MGGRWCLSTLGFTEYILPVTLSTSITPVSPYSLHRSLKLYLEGVTTGIGRCTCRLSPTTLREALGGRNWASVETHVEAKINWNQRSTGSRNWVHSDIHLEAMIDHDWRSTVMRLTTRQLIWRELIGTQSIGGRSIFRQSIRRQIIRRQQIWRQWFWSQWIWRR